MATFISILVAILILGVLVVVHELGHFCVGRAVGIGVEEFSVGFGPKLASRQGKKGIRYSLRALPIGGYVRFVGEDQDDDRPDSMFRQPVWRRFVTVLAGPVMNLILAVVLVVIVLMTYGEPMPDTLIAQVSEGQPAQTAGVRVGDRIVAVDGVAVEDTNAAIAAISGAGDQPIGLTVERDGQRVELTMTPEYNEQEGRNMIGIGFGTTRVRFGLADSLKIGCAYTVQFVKLIGETFSNLIFRGQGATDLMGPIGTIGVISQQTQQGGFEAVLRLGAMISINLGFFNLIPFPALDGGKLVLLVIEKIRRKPLPLQKEAYLNLAGLAVLLLLMVFASYQDIVRLFVH